MSTYYLDPTGSDTAAGLSPATAWRSLAKANAAMLQPGDSLLLARGATWLGSGALLRAPWTGTADSPITIGAYGTGPRPRIVADAQFSVSSQKPLLIAGAYLVVSGLALTVINPKRDAACLAPDGQGVRFGFHVCAHVIGHHITLSDCDLSHAAIGVNLFDTSHHVTVDDCAIHDLDTLWRYVAPGALGALGINIHGTDHEITRCLLEDNWAEGVRQADHVAVSYSAPFECYNASRVSIHHNDARGHRKTCEFGRDPDAESSGNVFAYNLVTSARPYAIGPNVHGVDSFGPIADTTIEHNTIVMTGPSSQALVVGGIGGAVVRDNILVAEWKAAFFSGVAPENNIYWDYRNTVDTSPTPFVQGATVPPEFKVPPLLDSNYIPLPGSPALTLATVRGVIGARLPIGALLMSMISDLQAQETFLRAQAAAATTLATALLAQADIVKANRAAAQAADAQLNANVTAAVAAAAVIDPA